MKTLLLLLLLISAAADVVVGWACVDPIQGNNTTTSMVLVKNFYPPCTHSSPRLTAAARCTVSTQNQKHPQTLPATRSAYIEYQHALDDECFLVFVWPGLAINKLQSHVLYGCWYYGTFYKFRIANIIMQQQLLNRCLVFTVTGMRCWKHIIRRKEAAASLKFFASCGWWWWSNFHATTCHQRKRATLFLRHKYPMKRNRQ